MDRNYSDELMIGYSRRALVPRHLSITVIGVEAYCVICSADFEIVFKPVGLPHKRTSRFSLLIFDYPLNARVLDRNSVHCRYGSLCNHKSAICWFLVRTRLCSERIRMPQ